VNDHAGVSSVESVAGPAVVAGGVEDLVVVATQEAVLVVPRAQSQRVREAVDALKARGHEAAG